VLGGGRDPNMIRHDATYKVEGAGCGLGLCAAHVHQHDATHDQACDEPLLHTGDLRGGGGAYREAVGAGKREGVSVTAGEGR
jgi:hypothetical protein